MSGFRKSVVLGVALLALVPACRQGEPEKPEPKPLPPAAEPAEEPEAKPHTKRGQQQVIKLEAPEKAPPASALPKVVLSDEFKATNRLKVGDKLADGKLPDLAAKMQPILKLLGPKLTVLVFWTAQSPYAQSELEDLQADVYKPLSGKGVQVIGINVDKDASKARAIVRKAGVEFRVLLDPEKKYFSTLAKDKFMRTYLVDEKGVIRWFDIDYSRSTERDLLQGVEFLLGPGKKK